MSNAHACVRGSKVGTALMEFMRHNACIRLGWGMCEIKNVHGWQGADL